MDNRPVPITWLYHVDNGGRLFYDIPRDVADLKEALKDPDWSKFFWEPEMVEKRKAEQAKAPKKEKDPIELFAAL